MSDTMSQFALPSLNSELVSGFDDFDMTIFDVLQLSPENELPSAKVLCSGNEQGVMFDASTDGPSHFPPLGSSDVEELPFASMSSDSDTGSSVAETAPSPSPQQPLEIISTMTEEDFPLVELNDSQFPLECKRQEWSAEVISAKTARRKQLCNAIVSGDCKDVDAHIPLHLRQKYKVTIREVRRRFKNKGYRTKSDSKKATQQRTTEFEFNTLQQLYKQALAENTNIKQENAYLARKINALETILRRHGIVEF